MAKRGPKPRTKGSAATDIQRTSRDRSLANLKPFKPGVSGNPKGRPKKDVCLLSLLKEELARVPREEDGKPNKLTNAALIAQAMVRQCKLGNTQLTRELLDRIAGRVPWPIRVGPESDTAPVSVIYVYLPPPETHPPVPVEGAQGDGSDTPAQISELQN